MANRAGRLRKEAQILHARAQEQEALHRAKNRRKSCRADAMAKALASSGSLNMPRAMRRKSVRLGLLKNPMLLLTLAMYCESPNRLLTLRKWQPPRSCNPYVLFGSFRKSVFALAPLKAHQLKCLYFYFQDANPAVAAWLVQTVTDPTVVSELPMSPANLLTGLNGKLYTGSMKYVLQYALRHAQSMLLGAHVDLAECISTILPAVRSKHEAYYIQGILFLIRHQSEINSRHQKDILNFMHAPLGIVTEIMQPFVEKQLGRPMLNFNVSDAKDVLQQLEQLTERLTVLQRDIMVFPFPDTPLCDVYHGTGVFEHYTIKRLRHPAALVGEGERMNHCVASYTSHCYYNRSSIWSLMVRGKRTATIELREHRQIVQFKGKNNSKVDGLPEVFMLKWAQAMGLKYISW